MRRTQIQFDEKTYQAIRRRAYECGRSISSVVRDLVSREFCKGRPGKSLSLKDFSFVGSGSGGPAKGRPISEDHDRALAEIFDEERRR